LESEEAENSSSNLLDNGDPFHGQTLFGEPLHSVEVSNSATDQPGAFLPDIAMGGDAVVFRPGDVDPPVLSQEEPESGQSEGGSTRFVGSDQVNPLYHPQLQASGPASQQSASERLRQRLPQSEDTPQETGASFSLDLTTNEMSIEAEYIQEDG
jgi:hypothetical protein